VQTREDIDNYIQSHVIQASSKLHLTASPPKEQFNKQKRHASTSEVPSNSSSLMAIAEASEQQQLHQDTSSRKSSLMNLNSSGQATTSNNISPLRIIKSLAQTAFPAAQLIPFLPQTSDDDVLGPWMPGHMDVIIEVEHCFDCHLHNTQSLRHDTKKYVQTANAVLYSLVKAVAESKLAVRLYALRSRPMSERRVGAFEVTVALRINLPPLPEPPAPVILKQPFGNRGLPVSKPKTEPVATEEVVSELPLTRWATHNLHSKLQTKAWPNIKVLEGKVVSFLETTIREAVHVRSSAISAANPNANPNDLKVGQSYRHAAQTPDEIKGKYLLLCFPLLF
jgi:hypothetical protein